MRGPGMRFVVRGVSVASVVVLIAVVVRGRPSLGGAAAPRPGPPDAAPAEIQPLDDDPKARNPQDLVWLARAPPSNNDSSRRPGLPAPPRTIPALPPRSSARPG